MGGTSFGVPTGDWALVGRAGGGEGGDGGAVTLQRPWRPARCETKSQGPASIQKRQSVAPSCLSTGTIKGRH